MINIHVSVMLFAMLLSILLLKMNRYASVMLCYHVMVNAVVSTETIYNQCFLYIQAGGSLENVQSLQEGKSSWKGEGHWIYPNSLKKWIEEVVEMFNQWEERSRTKSLLGFMSGTDWGSFFKVVAICLIHANDLFGIIWWSVFVRCGWFFPCGHLQPVCLPL